MIERRERWWLVAIMVLASIPRLVGITDDRLGYGRDEVIYAYDGWSIAETGTDHRQTGRPPLYLKGTSDQWDNRTSVLYPYLIAGISKIVGWPDVLAVRLPAVIGSLLVVLFVWAVTRQLFPNPTIARWAGAFAALNPLGALYARNAHDVIFLPLFSLAVAWAILSSRTSPRRWILAGLFLALGMYTYQPFKLVGLGVALLTTLYIWPSPRQVWRWMIGGALTCLIVAAPFLYTQLTKWSTVQSQFSGISVIGKEHAIPAVIKNLKIIFSGSYIYSVRLHLIFVPFLAGLAVILGGRRYRRQILYIGGWFLLGLLPVLLTKPTGSYLHIHHARALGTLGTLDVLGALGLVLFWEPIKNAAPPIRNRVLVVCGLIGLASVIITWSWFVVDQPWLSDRPFNGMKEGLTFVSQPAFVDRPVVVQQYGTQLSRFILWQTKFSPRQFQTETIGWGESQNGFQIPIMFGRFRMCTKCEFVRPGELMIIQAAKAPPGEILHRFRAYFAQEEWVVMRATEGGE